MATVKRVGKRYDAAVIEKLIYMPRLSEELIADPQGYAAWLSELESRLNAEQNISNRFEIRAQPAQDDQPAQINVTQYVHGINTESAIPFDFFSSSDYRRMAEMGEKLDGLLSEGAYIKRGERQSDISSFSQALGWLMEEAKRGQHIQRYKGLGEMNPEQLWETTMNPESRVMKQVTVEDAEAADHLFDVLMGDEVAPRKQFIQTHAATVQNLDI
jgi:DNA gyrase subunit B